MRCDACGSDIQRGKEVVTTKSEVIDGGETPTRTVTVTLCHACAERRGRIVRVLWLAFLALVVFTLLCIMW